MSLSGHAFCLIAFLLIFGIVSAAFAGGEDTTIDPLNGCFAKAEASSDDPKVEADFINHRGRYRIIADRFLSSTQCWNRKANCVGIPVQCYRDGKVVYEGMVKFWNGK